MAANAFVRVRIDEALKNEAAAVLTDMGLTVSDVVRIALTKIAREKRLPFEICIPNRIKGKHWQRANEARMFITPGMPKICSNSWTSDAPANLFRSVQARCASGAETGQGRGKAQKRSARAH